MLHLTPGFQQMLLSPLVANAVAVTLKDVHRGLDDGQRCSKLVGDHRHKARFQGGQLDLPVQRRLDRFFSAFVFVKRAEQRAKHGHNLLHHRVERRAGHGGVVDEHANEAARRDHGSNGDPALADDLRRLAVPFVVRLVDDEPTRLVGVQQLPAALPDRFLHCKALLVFGRNAAMTIDAIGPL